MLKNKLKDIQGIIADKKKRIYACEKHLWLFSLIYFIQYHHHIMPKFHLAMYNDLTFRNWSGVLWEMYRESAKSTLAKIKIIHSIVYSKKKFIIWTSYDQHKAEANLFDIAIELQTNKNLIADFGQLFYEDRLIKERFSRKKSIGEFITTNKIKVKAYSTGQSIRGEVYQQYRPDFCQPRGNNVLTNKGYKDVSEIKVNNFVLSHKGIYKRVIKNWVCQAEKIYSIKIKGLPYNITFSEKHKILAKNYTGKIRFRFKNYLKESFVDIDNIKKGSLIGFPINKQQKEYLWKIKKYKPEIVKRSIKGVIVKSNSNFISEFVKLNKNDYYIIGQFLGDGSLGENGIVIYCDANKQWIVDKIKKHCRYGICETRKKNVLRLTVNSVILQRICEQIKLNKNSWKLLPFEVESEIKENLKMLLQGYIDSDGFVDYKHNCIRITSVCLPLLEQIQRILLKFNITGYIRDGIDENFNYEICGNKCKTQKKYDLYFRDNVKNLGYDIISQTRYKNKLNFIENGYLWSYVEKIDNEKIKKNVYAFLVKDDKSYCNHLIANHNCVLDDIETSKTMVSDAKTQQVIEYIDELFSGVSGDADILILANRLIDNGSIAYLKDKIKNNKKWRYRSVAVKKNNKIVWQDKYVETIIEADEANKNVSDTKKQKISLEQKKIDLGITIYNREMMNRPLSDEEREFVWKWLQNYYTNEEIEKKLLNRYIAIDTADSKEREDKKNRGLPDFTGTVVVDWDIENNWYIRYAKQKRLNAPEMIEWIFYLWETFNPIKIGIEKKAFEDQIMSYIKIKSEETNIYPVVEELEHGGVRKEDRIRGALQGRFQAGKIKFLTNAYDDTEKLQNEIYDFPRAKFDDLIDSLAYCEKLGTRPIIRGNSNILTEVHQEFFDMRKPKDNLVNKIQAL